ncbi:hypothetical protein [Micropruina sp.]|uniref:hypothetical protein n=1 Tax=Micropruina sp. TaxID=2737536 RepID=UPI0039E5B5C2
MNRPTKTPDCCFPGVNIVTTTDLPRVAPDSWAWCEKCGGNPNLRLTGRIVYAPELDLMLLWTECDAGHRFPIGLRLPKQVWS